MALLEHPVTSLLDPSGAGPLEERRVVVRLVDGQEVGIGTAPTRDQALELARSVVSAIERPSGEWPLVGDRLLRPDAVVSVDVIRDR